MKILVDNYTNNAFKIEVKCEKTYDEYVYTYGNDLDYCGSVLEAEPWDIRSHRWSKGWPDNISGASYIVVCPLCGSWIEIPEDKLPKQVKENAKEIYYHG